MGSVLSGTPLLAHLGGLPVEEVLPGVLACGAAALRVATVWVRRRLGLRGARIAHRDRGAREGAW